MPFPDEVVPVTVHAYQHRWTGEFSELSAVLTAGLGTLALSVDHIGSTSVPGLAAKDVIDVQVLVRDESLAPAARTLAGAGFRERPEPWNRLEDAAGRTWPKRVSAPPPGARPVNVHVRVVGSATARRALLFRDFLRCNPSQRDAWGTFKQRLAAVVPDLADYGTVKAATWVLLMEAAEDWATTTGWSRD